MFTNGELIEYLQQFPAEATIREHHWLSSAEKPEDLFWYDEASDSVMY